MTLKMLLVYR